MTEEKHKREDRFIYEKGDLKITLPVCWNCKKNAGAWDCAVFGEKEYIHEKTCPEYVLDPAVTK